MSQLHKTDDVRITGITDIAAPETLRSKYPMNDVAAETVYKNRQAIHNVLHDDDDRMVIIVGPCSIHDTKAALEYAGRLRKMQTALEKDLIIIMRVYFEKPRTTVGWKGLINDPELDESFKINDGLCLARNLLLDINNMGLPTATEFLDLITPQYVADLISWGAIGARTTESQVHRELASGLSCPVGFKNSTNGSMGVAIDAISSSSQPHVFLSSTKQGHNAIFSTTGNDDCHIILRGGGGKPNYSAQHINEYSADLKAASLKQKMMVDFSHANSEKKHQQQIAVASDIAAQVSAGDHRIMGAMIESNLVAGQQDISDKNNLTYGQSITDACISWDETEPLLLELAAAVRQRRNVSANA